MDKKIVSNKSIGNAKRVTYEIGKTNETQITKSDIQKLLDGVEDDMKKKGGTYKILIRGMNGATFRTLKGFDEDELNFETEEDYLEGKVKDIAKFMKFFKLHFTIWHQK
jgi:hypothetical protein